MTSMRDTEKDMEESLLQKGGEDKRSETPALTWGSFIEELKRLGLLAGPMVAVTLSQYLLQVISIMMVGHLGELALSSTAIAISLSGVTGFSLLVSLRYHLFISSSSFFLNHLFFSSVSLILFLSLYLSLSLSLSKC